jgi:oligoendopeptidase F
MLHFSFKTKMVFVTVFTMFALMNSYSQDQKERGDIADRYKWDTSGIFPTDEEWRKAKNDLEGRLDDIEKYKGTLTLSATNLLGCLQFNSDISKEASRLFLYAGLNSDIDTRVMKYNGMKQELQQMFSQFGAKSAFIEPEILSVEWEKIEGFIETEPGLEIYRIWLEELFRTREHTLSEAEERIMALSGQIGGISQSVFGTFSNAEMPQPEVTLSTGETIKLNSATYGQYRAAPNRTDRQLVFETFWGNYANFRATFGEMLYGNVKKDIFYVKARKYNSSLEAALYPKNIPTEVYHSLVENVNKNLPAFHRYLGIKKRMMGLDTLKYIDLYAPAVADVDLKYSYDEAVEITLEALKPLGKEYVKIIKQAIDERWIDVYPTPGKRSGAYSNGAFYDGNPFILLNYTGLYNDVSTMVHELGHTMHSYLSNKNQPYPMARYQIFVAEVASTLNEVLLFNYMLDKIDNDDVKLSLLMNWLDSFKGTLFRQTQFAEYELRIHEIAEKGQPLTGDEFSKLYADIVKTYYGHDMGVCHVDDYVDMEWAFIPHFYYNFYVYQYSTSFTASISLAEKVMSGDEEAIGRYLEFLSAGGSDYPIELLKTAGVDMTSPEPFNNAIESMNKVMDEIEKILDARE